MKAELACSSQDTTAESAPLCINTDSPLTGSVLTVV